eukprot:CAMPEP_0172045912 /NCGR_PEP_ID=MMETSP1043-20130122/121_1 /TAXON_ID=464988 /ORGANISM="Hemiselmis andersenii, Strain CCMP441" /LENGTH=103 /DNA_ID=CAMNT_0012704517 /DNA_START=381 /DNA_END=689 /DNA_ORIENTATION=-
MVWALTLDGKRANIGHIAVPVSRVAASVKEEGWYEVRKSDGQVQTGEGGGKNSSCPSQRGGDQAAGDGLVLGDGAVARRFELEEAIRRHGPIQASHPAVQDGR